VAVEVDIIVAKMLARFPVCTERLAGRVAENSAAAASVEIRLARVMTIVILINLSTNPTRTTG
jgi:hypothetical protein